MRANHSSRSNAKWVSVSRSTLARDTIEELSEIYSTSGQYDLLGKFYLEPEQDTGLFVTEKVQTLPGVKDTYTLITFNAFTGPAG